MLDHKFNVGQTVFGDEYAPPGMFSTPLALRDGKLPESSGNCNAAGSPIIDSAAIFEGRIALAIE